MNPAIANGSTPAPGCPSSLTATSATPIRIWPTPAATRPNAGARSQHPRLRSTPARPTPPTAAMTLRPAPPIHRHDPADLAACCLPSAPLRGGSRVARTLPRQDAPLTCGPCHVRCHGAPVPPATARPRPPAGVAHSLPRALGERKGNHAHNGQEKRNGKQHQRQARRGDPSPQDSRRHLAEHPHRRRRVLQRPYHPPFPPRVELGPHSRIRPR